MSNYVIKVKGIIREAIWNGMLEAAQLKDIKNPYAVSEYLEQNIEFLNKETEETYKQLIKYAEIN